MADLLSAQDKAFFQSSLLDLFDTFARDIIVHKEPIKIIQSSNVDLLPGYGESSTPENIKYTPVNQTFKAMISYKKNQSTEANADIGMITPGGEVRIKVQQATRNYIMDGKTERIEFDGKSFNLVSRDAVQDYWGMQLFIFYLEEVS